MVPRTYRIIVSSPILLLPITFSQLTHPFTIDEQLMVLLKSMLPMVAYLSQRILEIFQCRTCRCNLFRYMSSPASLPCLFLPWALYVMLDVLLSLLPLPWKLNYTTTWYCKATEHHQVYGFFSCRRTIRLSFQMTIQCYHR